LGYFLQLLHFLFAGVDLWIFLKRLYICVIHVLNM
jgi:hypothetical protein